MKKIYISPETGVLTVKVATLLTVSLSQTTGYAGEAAEARARGKKTDEFTEEEEEMLMDIQAGDGPTYGSIWGN